MSKMPSLDTYGTALYVWCELNQAHRPNFSYFLLILTNEILRWYCLVINKQYLPRNV